MKLMRHKINTVCEKIAFWKPTSNTFLQIQKEKNKKITRMRGNNPKRKFYNDFIY